MGGKGGGGGKVSLLLSSNSQLLPRHAVVVEGQQHPFPFTSPPVSCRWSLVWIAPGKKTGKLCLNDLFRHNFPAFLFRISENTKVGAKMAPPSPPPPSQSLSTRRRCSALKSGCLVGESKNKLVVNLTE